VDPRTSVRSSLLGLGLLMAVVAAFVPFFVALVPLVALALALGSLLAGVRRGTGRMLLVAAGASLVAAVLHLPWTFDFLPPHGEWLAFAGVKSAAPGIGFGHALRFQTGPIGAGLLGWAFLAAAALPLLIGRGWRATWAVRAWTVALFCWVGAWAAGRTGFP